MVEKDGTIDRASELVVSVGDEVENRDERTEKLTLPEGQEVYISDNWWHQDGKIMERERHMYYAGGYQYAVYNVVAFGVSDTSIYVLALAETPPAPGEDLEPLDYWIFTRNPGPDGLQVIRLPNCAPTRGPSKRK